MNNDLLFLSGNDIPFPEGQITIRQPKVKEIAYIGEESFYTGLEILNISKNNLTEKDNIGLNDLSNFDILIAILNEPNMVMQKYRNCIIMVLSLLFPEYSIEIKRDIVLKKEEEVRYINNDNFENFKKIINEMFSFKNDTSLDFNPAGDMSKRIAEKLKKRHERLSQKSEGKKIDIISRYISILSIGLKIDINTLFSYTTYQLFDTFKRYELNSAYDIYLRAAMAGAKDQKEVEDWMQDIHKN